MARKIIDGIVWEGSWYYRSENGTWRNKHTGHVALAPQASTEKKLNSVAHYEDREITGAHTYGRDAEGHKGFIKVEGHKTRVVPEISRDRRIMSFSKASNPISVSYSGPRSVLLKPKIRRGR